MYPNLYNIPGMQNMPWMNNIPGMNQIKSKWSEINPFRTVERRAIWFRLNASPVSFTITLTARLLWIERLAMRAQKFLITDLRLRIALNQLRIFWRRNPKPMRH